MTTPTFVAGGEKSFVENKIAGQLSRHGLRVAGHWDWKRRRSMPIPDEVEVVFVITDMCSHTINDRVVAAAQKRKLPVIYGQRKYAANQERLTAAGYPPVTLQEPTMQTVPKELRRDLYRKAIAEDMSRDHDAVYEALTSLCEVAKGGPYAMSDLNRSYVSNIRGSMGISWARGRARSDGTRLITVHVGQYEDACSELGIAPHYPVGAVRQGLEQAEPAKDPKPAPPKVAPMKAEPAPVPKAKPEPTIKLPAGWTQEFADILVMLRDEMAECDIQSLSITPDGVTFERVVIVRGTYDG